MRDGDMTSGKIGKLLLYFAAPLLLGNLLQQLYNAFDAIVVGNFVGNEALAAVGATGPLINMIIAFFIGMSSGASVLISQYYGARNAGGVHDTVHTAMLLAVIIGIVFSIIGVVFSPTLLRWMHTPEDILHDAALYLRIYFAGLVALTVYNMGTAVLTATGDSKRPLYFLAISAALNIILNILFVYGFGMGVDGVAWSTVISQTISAVLVVMVLLRANTDFRLFPGHLRINTGILRKITIIGLPGGIQQAIISASNIAVQAYVNDLGSVTIAAYSASNKLDAFIMLPVQTMGLAVTTFVGQNLGARQVDRAKRGTRFSLILGISVTIALAAVVLLFGRSLLRIFSPDPAVLEDGYRFIQVFAGTYFILAFTQILPGALRGAGDVRVATLVCIASFVAIRQVYLYFVTKIEYSIFTVAMSYPVTWLIAALVLLFYYRHAVRKWDVLYAREPEVPASEGTVV